MLSLDIPGFKALHLEHLVLDFNGVLAIDGKLIPGTHDRLRELAQKIHVHVVTADTFGSAARALEGLEVTLKILPPVQQDEGKQSYIETLVPGKCACIGNGRNDRLMLKDAALGIAVMQIEGVATETLLASDLLVADIHSALDLLLSPMRIKATLRT